MPIDPRSELTVDIDESITKAYNSTLPSSEQKLVHEHLVFILPKLTEPNTLIEPIRSALSAMDSRKQWHEKPIGILAIGIIVAVIAAAIIFKFGWN